MCGILLVKSKASIAIEKHLSAFDKLNSRGPDFNRWQYKNNIFIGQTVLHITGNTEYYHQKHDNFLAYNGEIYNFQEFGNYSNDVEFVDYAVNNDLSLLKQGWGPWAFAWSDFNTVLFASDPQGEKNLYYYQDPEILIVCSEVVPILDYIENIKVDVPYNNKAWTILDQTPWKGIYRVEPGMLYNNGSPRDYIDNIWDWIEVKDYKNFDNAYEEFNTVWQYIIDKITPDQSASLSYSGGLDSSLIMDSIPNLELQALNMIGKDPIVECIDTFLNNDEKEKLHVHNISTQDWARYYCELMSITKLPVQSWSCVGKWIVAKNCKTRILFSGLGADELFGGYDIYKNLNFSPDKSSSVYSHNLSSTLWNKCLDAYNGDCRQATLLMDYLAQIVGSDATSTDRIGGAWSIEYRNPFIAKPLMQFALSLPFEYKVSNVSKPLIRRKFLERWNEDLIFVKKGFTGHANDSMPWLNVKINPTGDRHLDWQQIAITSFYTDSNCGPLKTTLV